MPVSGRRDTNDDRAALMFGALLHDIGKVIYRGWSGKGTHSRLGADFLRDEVAPSSPNDQQQLWKKVAEQVRYHHAREMAMGSLDSASLAYITYFADNISAGMDRKNEGDEDCAPSFDRSAKLRKIYNILNGHHDDGVIEHKDYNTIREELKTNLHALDIDLDQVNSLLNVLEATTSTVPSSTNRSQLIDVSLYDHAKTTAGIAICIYEYLTEQGVYDYRSALFDRQTSKAYYAKDMFLLYSCDMSGIQSFIYNISGDGALKQLRARSMYLELLLEDVADELLNRLSLTRANLLYTGGGHAYLLLPNTEQVKSKLAAFGKELTQWFVDTYRTDLFLASAWVPCSADDLANKVDATHADGQRYRNLYRELTRKLSTAKASRYAAATLRVLNFGGDKGFDHSRECTECHRSDVHIDEEGKCPLCAALGRISKQLVDKDVFAVSMHGPGLDLPFGRYLVMYSRDAYLQKKPEAVRIYTKNNWDTGLRLATHIWMGDYTAKVDDESKRFEDYASYGVTLPLQMGCVRGVKRLGVLRADVDNLGATFVNGLPDGKVSISRTATLSRSLSFFFKRQINEVLGAADYRLQVIYSGGDDIFIVGNWSDVIYAALDIRNAFAEYVGNGTLTISAGIGIYDETFPIARMALETGELEDAAKLYVSGSGIQKNALALWTEDAALSWQEFEAKVLSRKEELQNLFTVGEHDKGNSFIYQLVALLRSSEGVSLPRLAYLLARSFEGVKDGVAKSKRIYDWAQDKAERTWLVLALEWYVYTHRERS